MGEGDGYGQYCPIALTAEILARRWTPLVVRALVLGATRFNDIHASVPRMSSALLSRRLGELEHAGILTRETVGERGVRYRLTPAGEELFPVLEEMGFWARKWLRREVTREENLDPDLLMWEVRRGALASDRSGRARRVARFQLSGVPVARRFYWVVMEPGDVDVCAKDPGFEVDLYVSAHVRDLVEIWLGYASIEAARADGRLVLDGPREEITALPDWFRLSHFARPRRHGAGEGDGSPSGEG